MVKNDSLFAFAIFMFSALNFGLKFLTAFFALQASKKSSFDAFKGHLQVIMDLLEVLD